MNNLHHKRIVAIEKIKVLCQKLFKLFSSKLFKDSMYIIITTIIATIIATLIIDRNNKEYASSIEKEKLLYDLQTICIGCNKDWMDTAFGTPVFTNKDDLIIEEVYITDIALIRAFFEVDNNACIMFFVTQTSDEPIPLMPTISNYYYNAIGKEEKLGILTYNEINYININLFVAYGFFTNGTGRTFYGEGYHNYFGSRHDIYFASLDYGENNPWNMMGYIYNDDISNRDLYYYENLDDNGLNRHHAFLSERDKFYPNTYGVSSLDSDYTFDKLMDYNTFDSIETAYR